MRDQKGFSLIEIMVTMVLLLLGTALVHESFLFSAALFGRYTNGLRAELWMGERLWKAEEALLYSSEEPPNRQEGSFNDGARDYSWTQEVRPLSEKDLYGIRLLLSWQEGGKPMSLEKETYAFKRDFSKVQ